MPVSVRYYIDGSVLIKLCTLIQYCAIIHTMYAYIYICDKPLGYNHRDNTTITGLLAHRLQSYDLYKDP